MIKTIPNIVGSLWTICEGLQENLEKISSRLKLEVVLKTALSGTAQTLDKVLAPQVQKHFS